MTPAELNPKAAEICGLRYTLDERGRVRQERYAAGDVFDPCTNPADTAIVMAAMDALCEGGSPKWLLTLKRYNHGWSAGYARNGRRMGQTHVRRTWTFAVTEAAVMATAFGAQ